VGFCSNLSELERDLVVPGKKEELEFERELAYPEGA
jgi:hypothetical protein